MMFSLVIIIDQNLSEIFFIDLFIFKTFWQFIPRIIFDASHMANEEDVGYSPQRCL
jgi:hypothetical protein